MSTWPTEPGERIPVPEPGAPFFPDINEFALTYNGYDRHGDQAGDIGNSLRARWDETGELTDDLAELRCALFFEQRRYHHFGTAPQDDNLEYIEALVDAIRQMTGGSVEGPGDPYP